MKLVIKLRYKGPTKGLAGSFMAELCCSLDA
jgi:hypothetical protein